MNNAKVLVFCSVTLAATLAVCILAGRAVMVPEATVQAAQIPEPVEAFRQPIDIGSRLGKVSVGQLVEYFIEHPPKSDSTVGGPGLPVQHFGGC